MSYSIAIDGPAGAGKSTIAKIVAKKRKCIYVDTGAMYRATALHLVRNNITKDATDATVSEVAKTAKVSIEYKDGEQQVLLNGENVSGLIRTPEVSQMASVVATNNDVRAYLVSLQQEIAKTADVVMDGRDIGTVVLPGADTKIYLTASVECRAKRRYDELIAKGEECDLEATAKEIAERDYRDMNREHSPLKQADDAVLVDSSDMTIDEVVEKILSLCK